MHLNRVFLGCRYFCPSFVSFFLYLIFYTSCVFSICIFLPKTIFIFFISLIMDTSKETFDIRNEEKRTLHTRHDINRFYVQPREIWYVKLGVNIWFEQNGKREFQRPVLVVERIWILLFVIPLSTKEKNSPYYYKLQSTSFDKPSMAMLSQIRVIDKRRFVNQIGLVSKDELCIIKKLLKEMYLKGV